MEKELNITQEDIEQNKVVAALSYLWILFILYWVVDSPYVKFHAKQSLAIFIADVLLFFLSIVLGFMSFFLFFFPTWLITWPLGILLFVFHIWGFVNAISGKVVKLPIFGDLADRINV